MANFPWMWVFNPATALADRARARGNTTAAWVLDPIGSFAHAAVANDTQNPPTKAGRTTGTETGGPPGKPVTPPPSVTANTSQATQTAFTAAERQRKRAAAGGTVLSAAQSGRSGPGASLQPRTLIGY